MNIKAGERFGKALDLSLDVMRKTSHTKLKKSAFELHYCRKPNTEITNLLNLDNLKEFPFSETRYLTGILIQRSWQCVRPATDEDKKKR